MLPHSTLSLDVGTHEALQKLVRIYIHRNIHTRRIHAVITLEQERTKWEVPSKEQKNAQAISQTNNAGEIHF